MRDYSKTEIRLQRVATRQLKVSYKRLTPEEKKLVKALEGINQSELDMNRFWRTHTKRDENNHIILDDKESELFKFLDDKHRSYSKKLDRIAIKNNWSDEKIDQIWRLHQQDNCHSVSY